MFRLDQERRLHDQHRIRLALRQLLRQLRLPRDHRRMNDRVQLGSPAVNKGDSGKHRPVQRPRSVQNLTPEVINNRPKDRLPRLHHLPPQIVRGDHMRAHPGKHRGHRRLPAPQTAGKTDAQHAPKPRATSVADEPP